jgi:hypothetical protein
MQSEPRGSLEFTVGAAGPGVHYAISGLQPDSSHPVSIFDRDCGRPGGVPVGTIRADPAGAASGDMLLPAALTAPPGLAIGVGPDASPVDPSLACAHLEPGRSAALTPGPGFDRVRATARLSYDLPSRVLTVRVHVTGLEPGSHHPSHIHTGQCESEGPIRETLNAVDADSHGNADAVTTVPQSDGIKFNAWYIAVHAGPGLGSQSQYALLACGDVVR